jgi:hypothetical protein
LLRASKIRFSIRLKVDESGCGINLRLSPVLCDEHQTYGVIAVDYPKHQHVVGVVVLAYAGETMDENVGLSA